MKVENVEGGCLCTAIRFRFNGIPLGSSICHCQTCRRASSAPSVAWITVDRDAFQFRAGYPQRYKSSEGVTRTFCGLCGSPLTYENKDDPASIDIHTVALDRPEDYPPTRESWLVHKLSWAAVNAERVLTPRALESASMPVKDALADQPSPLA